MSTKIEWVKNPDGTKGETWNPVTGCTPISPGCKNCYARRMARRLAGRYGYPPAPNHFDVTLRPDRLDEPHKWRKPRRVFVCSMSDLFHKGVPFEFVDKIFWVMAKSVHVYQILTKRPARMLEFFARYRWGILKLDNVHLGVTAENQATADERIPVLLQIPAAVHFMSGEPLLGEIDIDPYLPRYDYRPTYEYYRLAYPGMTNEPVKLRDGLNLVIAGGETGPGARPMHPEWVRSLRDQCQATGTPFFFKSWGAWMAGETKSEPFGPIEVGERCIEHNGQYTRMYRVGAKQAGRLLDGQLWEQMPD